jgi:hypothetical protein
VRSLLVEGLPVRRGVVPLLEQEGPIDPGWRFLLEQVYPNSRPERPWSLPLATEMDQALEQVLQHSSFLR